MKKLVELFKYGLEMYANTLYGDINCKNKKEEDLSKDLDRRKKKQRKKSVQSYSHLKVIK
ncbi:hypothetical protein JMM81_15745 [Bacillus sp. V3B]|uniref:hypothetical protein n=1 Tax=Bacillus sp. V3B TaxID=2804915 RepID=UPI00210A3B9C|nr:hypothetical protein [Bacillus sp. V3B]MCQ6276368.1 hypothetical protein [Bacillus sp. V3B]